MSIPLGSFHVCRLAYNSALAPTSFAVQCGVCSLLHVGYLLVKQPQSSSLFACRMAILSFQRVLRYCGTWLTLNTLLITGIQVCKLQLGLLQPELQWHAPDCTHAYLSIHSDSGDLQKRAKVDAALDWNHSNVRANAAGLTWHRVIGKNLKQPVSEGQANHFEAGIQTTFKVWNSCMQLLDSCQCNAHLQATLHMKALHASLLVR